MSGESTLDEIVTLYENREELTYEELDETGQYTMDTFLRMLEEGQYRVAEPSYDQDWTDQDEWEAGWEVNEPVKKGILAQFGIREIEPREIGGMTYNDVLGVRDGGEFDEATRNVPTDTTVREGAYLGNDVTMMGPAYVNIGAHIGDGTLIDSCDTIGSAAQIGEDAKIGANTLIGGVLSPAEATPVVIEDEAKIGGGNMITSGFRVGEGTVTGENTLLTPRIPVYDFPSGEVMQGHVLPNRKVFNRQVKSSLSNSEAFDQDFYGPAIVATDVDEDTMADVQGAEELSFD